MGNQIVRTFAVRPAILLLGEDTDGVAYHLGFGLPPLSRQAPDQRLRFCVQPHTQSHDAPFNCNTQVYYSAHALSTLISTRNVLRHENRQRQCSAAVFVKCGSSLFRKTSAVPDLAMIAAGSLDDPSPYKPTLDFFTSSAQPWDHMNPVPLRYALRAIQDAAKTD
jgi:hypothetical protein